MYLTLTKLTILLFLKDKVTALIDPFAVWKHIVLYDTDVLYTKVIMPHYTGYELATMVKRQNNNIRVVFTSKDGTQFLDEAQIDNSVMIIYVI